MLIVPFVNTFFAFPALAISFFTDTDSIWERRKCKRGSVVFDIPTTKRFCINHIQRLESSFFRKDQNAVLGCTVIARKAVKLAVRVFRDRMYEDGAQLLAVFVGVTQWWHA